jgi:hypothetical protein
MSNGLPDGFGSTKKLKRRKDDVHDRKLIKTLSKQAVEKLVNDDEAKVQTVAKDLVSEFYRKHRTPTVCPWFFWMDPLVFTR